MDIHPTFTKPGYTYHLVDRLGDAVIYEQIHNATGRALAYEVMIVQRVLRDTILPGERFLAKGSPFLPGSESWGRLAWTVPNLAQARLLMAKKGTPAPTLEIYPAAEAVEQAETAA